MFASRFFQPALRTAARTFTTTTAARTPFAFRQTSPNFFRYTYQNAQRQSQGPIRFRGDYQRFKNTGNFFRRWAARPTFYYEVGGIGVLFGGFYIANLETVPVSGRRRFNVLSIETEKTLGDQMYAETLNEFREQIMPPNSKEHQQVQRVLERLIPHSGLGDEKWEIHVIDDDMKNAFVIPGGKVFVFRGILDICQGDDGLAAVLGHEIAHNVCHHASERTSQTLILLPIGAIAYIIAGIDPSLLNIATSIAFTWPGSRKQESEADKVGLLMMAESCYDPSAAIGLWQRMEKEERGAPPQFLSTHPSSHNRMEQIREWLPEAEVKRESSDCSAIAHLAGDFQQYAMAFRRW